MLACNNRFVCALTLPFQEWGKKENGQLKAKPAHRIYKMHVKCVLTICKIQGVSFIAGLLAVERATSLLRND